MPYGIRRGGQDCPHEVYNSETDKRVQGGCHDTRADALAHQRAMMRRVSDAAAVASLDPQPGEHFHSIAHREGVTTGLRTFTNLTWRDVPFAFHWQKGSSAHGGTPMTVQTGLVTRVERDPEDENVIHSYGTLDLGGEDGREYGRQLVAGFARWVSIGLDESPAKTTIEWGEDADDDDSAPMQGLMKPPEQVHIDGGCIGELTGVSVPAQADATIEPTPELVRALQELGALDAPVDAADIWNDGWDAASISAEERRKGAEEGWAMDDGSFPIRNCREVEKAVHAMNHKTNKSNEAIHRHIVSRAKKLGCESHLPSTWPSSSKSAAQAPPFTKEGESECPDGQTWDPEAGECVPVPEKAGSGIRFSWPISAAMEEPPPEEHECPEGEVWDPEAGECVPENLEEADALRGYGAKRRLKRPPSMADVVEAITAASYRIEIPELPPASWFEEPTDVEIPGAFCVTDEGRIYGILAPLNTNHRAYAQSGRKMYVPNRTVDYSRFLGGEALTSTGRLAGVGPITMDCGHAPRFRENGDVAPAHYENACSVIGKVRVGETAEGLPWVAGALEPGVTPSQLSRMLACRLSGDWQPHADKPGWDELVACLLVPSPGFPMGRTGPTVDLDRDGALVASSMPVQYIGDFGEAPRELPYEDAVEAIVAAARAAGSDDWARRARRLNARRLAVKG